MEDIFIHIDRYSYSICFLLYYIFVNILRVHLLLCWQAQCESAKSLSRFNMLILRFVMILEACE